MRIAIIGTGIAGNVAAYKLHTDHEITVFEQNSHIGGHSHTHALQHDGRDYEIDTGFIVLNDRTYPNFTNLLQDLDIETQPTEMSFSVKCELSDLEYNGNNLNTLFAQRSNLFRPKFYRMIADILRFNREGYKYLSSNHADISLGDYLEQGRYNQEFVEQYIVPMGAAIWSAEPSRMLDFPARFFMRFFANHGLLNVNDRPLWSVIRGGSHRYVQKLVAGFKDRIRINCPVRELKRYDDRVEIISDDHGVEAFDYAFIASHSDQALAMLSAPTLLEKKVLSAIPYQENEALLHTDDSLLPNRKLAWAAWNYHRPENRQDRLALTYNMNILQNIQSPHTFCVTLNHSEQINQNKVIKSVRYHHPVFTPEGIRAQSRLRDINGQERTYFCGAYWRNGFHEDGVVSALTALEHFKQDTGNNAQLHLRRAS